jgi:hypothetical protein
VRGDVQDSRRAHALDGALGRPLARQNLRAAENFAEHARLFARALERAELDARKIVRRRGRLTATRSERLIATRNGRLTTTTRGFGL